MTAKNKAAAGDAENIFDEMVAIKQRHVDLAIDWYKKSRFYPLFWFRTTGVITILASIMIPFVSSLQIEPASSKEVVMSALALLVAVFTSLSQFFQWSTSWEGRVSTWKLLNRLVGEWEVGMSEARFEPDPAKATKLAIDATKNLLDEAYTGVGEETKRFFDGVKFPQKPGGK